jgi:hypothetical protein
MIYAFWNAVVLYLILDKWAFFINDLVPRMPKLLTMLFNCVYCLSFWLSLTEVVVFGLTWYMLGMIWCLTVIFYKLL